MKKTYISCEIDPALHKKLKQRILDDGTTMRAIVAKYVAAGLEKSE